MENQNLEWKQSWHDDYLSTLCGFANANGGIMEIGRHNNGEIIGVPKIKKLLDDLPNKIRSAMGIIPSVDVLEEDGKQYLSVAIKPYSFPISCNGKYYMRSGSTTQELSGAELDGFILRVQGKTWDSVPVPHVKFNEFENDAFKAFRRKAIASGRLTAQDLEITDEMLLHNLRLADGDYLKRAAILLFHQDPENWMPGAYIKIGFFENAADILYQDEIHGPLITMADKAEDLVFTKYFKGIISYEGLQRIETFPVPRLAFREAVLNAVIHRDYSTGNPIHIHIYPNEVLIYNDGGLPENWTIEKLFASHTSLPRNPMIAGGFFRSGQIEAWGRGIEKMTNARKFFGQPEPFYRTHSREVMIGFKTEVQFGEKFGEKFGENQTQEKIMEIMRQNPKASAKAIAEKIGLTARGVEKVIKTLKSLGLVERVGAAKGGRWEVKKR